MIAAGLLIVFSGRVTGANGPEAVTWQEAGNHRVRPLPVPASGRSGFSVVPADRSGVDFTNHLSDDQLARNQILEVGSGVALGDVDGDGRVDIYFCALEGGNRLYRNLGGWKFEDITERSQVGCPGQFSTGAVLADVDGDGDLDLLVNAIGRGTRLFLNEGAGRFAENKDAGLHSDGGSTSMALADVNGDGFLDLYVANYNSRTVKDSLGDLDVRAGYVDGKFVVSRPDLFSPIFTKSGGVTLFERGQPDMFYLNDGHGRFQSVSWTNGVFLDEMGRPLAETPRDWGLSVAFRDLNGDGFPDLYVCNDFFGSPDHVRLNDGHGRFKSLPRLAIRQQSMSSMAVDFADLNRDGVDDILVVDMLSRDHQRRQRQRGSLVHLQARTPNRDPLHRPEYPRNTLFLARGDGTYAEIAQYAGLDASEWSWSVSFLDVDLDGFEDVLITTGNLRDANDGDVAAQRAGRMGSDGGARNRPRFARLETARLAFRNRGDLTFEETGRGWNFDQVGIAHGLAMADLDNDGDLDLVVNEMGRAASLYRNESDAPRVVVRLKGQPPNTHGVGAKIVVLGGAQPRQSQEIMSGGRYLSSDNAERCFAGGTLTNRLRLEVTWRSGVRTILENAENNCIYEIAEPDTRSTPAAPASPAKALRMALFENRSAELKRAHQEADYDDFATQPLLPRRLSQLGPGVCWSDLDGDGWEDLLMAGGAREHPVLFLNTGRGEFRAMRRAAAPDRDQTTQLAIHSATGSVHLLIGYANYEDGRTNGHAVTMYDPQRDTESGIVPAADSSVGPLALGSVANELALFVGGRVRPGRYPEAAASQIYLHDHNGWRLQTNGVASLQTVGMASGALWADWDGDGQPELFVATEWGPVRAYAFQSGRWIEQTQPLGLDQFPGFWNGIAAGDFDGDGRLDLVASNWGLNSKYRRHADHPIRIYYGDWMGLNRIDPLEAYYEPALRRYVPFATLDQLRAACPMLAEPYPTFALYATAGIDELLGRREAPPAFREAHWFASTMFLNRGNRVEARSLPAEAQLAPAFGVSVGDLDGDGHEDLFLSQNFFGTDAETSRLDAGRGLCLRGDGRGNFTAMTAAQSGIELYGEQRGSALCDYDQDGRVDLVVAQNRGPLGLFRNVGATPGLQVRLRGPAWNRDAIGASLRLRHGDHLGPARVISAGSGYWSQDSHVPVLGPAAGATAVQVRWPGGKVTEHRVPIGAKDMEISAP